MGEDFKILTRRIEVPGAERHSGRKLPLRGAALAVAAALGLGLSFLGIRAGKEHFFPGDNRVPITSTLTFPPCHGNNPLPPMEFKLIPGTELVEGPAGSDKTVTITVNENGELAYAPVTGVTQQPHTADQDSKTVNFTFDKDGTERISVLGVPDSSPDPALRSRAVVVIRQLCNQIEP